MIAAQRIRVTGVVQGVGFRPFVWRLARELELAGWVRNDSHGVEISAEGCEQRLAALLERLGREAPALARIERVTAESIAPRGLDGFRITESVRERCATAIGPDTGVCADCLAELFDPGDRRWRHAFITCTHCGPRYTIARALPYDRARTSMSGFPLCPECAREYADPADRRFHAEPIACPQCGPRLRLVDRTGQALAGDPVARALGLLADGAILAVKGLGGYHLACDARSAAAVARLRARKDREAKPLAVMCANPASAVEFVELDAAGVCWLVAAERPIVLAGKRHDADLRLPGIAPGLAQLGVMLPATPLQWLLFHEAAGRPAGCDWLCVPQPLVLVMTSANPRGEPIVTGDGEAIERLGAIADAFLQHDREILVRCDDSVLIAGSTTPTFVRRARGFTPEALRLPAAGPPVLALGAFLKNTVCVTRGAEAFVSQHIGDLDTAASCVFLEESVAHLLALLEVEPLLIAHDLHPDLPSSRIAAAMASAADVPLIAVQHHHAHVAAVVAEHRLQRAVLGLTLDGVGLGSDGGAWGGELLIVDGARMERLGHLSPLPMPGGDRAAREPWRMGAAALHALGRGREIARRYGGQRAAARLATLLERPGLWPVTSSMGRVFDAAASLLGICAISRFEAEAAMRLEALARGGTVPGGAHPEAADWVLRAGGVLELLPLLARLADWDGEAAAGAAYFHARLAAALAEWVADGAARSGLASVVLAGGCFGNGLLGAQLTGRLTAMGLEVLRPLRLPPGDGAISLGQAWVAICTGSV